MRKISPEKRQCNQPGCPSRPSVHCETVIMNGCDTFWCLWHFGTHSEIHENEWALLTDQEKDRIIQERTHDATN